MGMRGVENVSLVLRARIPADQVIGGLDGFRRVLVEGFSAVAHVGWAAVWLGAAAGVQSQLLRAMRAKARSDSPTAQIDRQRLALIRCRLEAVGAYLRCVVDEVARCRAAEESLELPAVQIHVNTLKVLAARETFAAVDEMVTMAGLGTGYLRTAAVPLERVFRDLRAASLTFDDSRLLAANGTLAWLDPAVTTVGDW
jgi:acyl-CoA dehydrogenase